MKNKLNSDARFNRDMPVKIKTALVGVAGVFCVIFFSLGNSFAKQNDNREVRKIDVKAEYENSRVGHIQVTYIIQAPVETSWEIFNNFDQMTQFIPRLLYAKLLGAKQALEIIKTQPKSFEEALNIIEKYSKDPGEKYFRNDQGERGLYVIEQFDFPWPFSNRWALYEAVQRSNSSQRVFSHAHRLVAGSIKDEKGSWNFRVSSLNPLWTEVFYSIVSEPGFQMPAFIAKMAARKTAHQMMGAIRERAEWAPH